MTVLTFRRAEPSDAGAVAELVRNAYRGEESRAGWTTEADLLTDERIDADGVRAKIVAPGARVLLAGTPTDPLLACCELVHRGEGLAYFGMFAVRPTRQDGGVGRRVLLEAERIATTEWAVTTMEMTVIAARAELIAWYVRRGYEDTGETRPFPYAELVNGVALREDLHFAVLRKALPGSS